MTGDIRRTWLRHWHSVIDDAFGSDPTFDFESAYQDPYTDFRMHFQTWDLPDENLRRCFEILPLGKEMCTRASELRHLLRSDIPTTTENEALELFRSGLDGFAKFVEDEELQKPPRLLRVRQSELIEQTRNTDRIAILFETAEQMCVIDEDKSKAGSFLCETLYRLAHSYDVVDYITWPLYPDPDRIDPFRNFALLALTNRYYPGLDANGPILFVVTND